MTMEIQAKTISPTSRREPWNKGKLIGQKPPLRPKHVWSIRAKLQMQGRLRDLAMFNLAIDTAEAPELPVCEIAGLARIGETMERRELIGHRLDAIATDPAAADWE